ncbi:MAG: aminoacyl-tRNA hydrolase [Candidatus Gastranaerophilales bacterium]|nr:aminoacyl-tRNA hydrolase [Candidatus Gastranaerophilales bacterium]
MYIIVGLGNPGSKYENTRHNIGFSTIDKLAEQENIQVLERKHKALLGKGYIAGSKCILVKPQTFMNLSGESVRELIDYYKVDEKSDLIIISDDISLDVGQIRIRKKGSAGGHNGLKNIISHLGHDQFVRIRMGVGEKPEQYELIDYVLGHFSKEEGAKMDDASGRAADAVRMMIAKDVESAMTTYNRKA